VIKSAKIFNYLDEEGGFEIEIAELNKISSIQIGEIEIRKMPGGSISITRADKTRKKTMIAFTSVKEIEPGLILKNLTDIQISPEK